MLHIVRRERYGPGHELRQYAHLGTGNYHPDTARRYTDYSLLTADPALCANVLKIFQQLSGMGRARQTSKLLHAPVTLHARLMAMIEREAAHARQGKHARV